MNYLKYSMSIMLSLITSISFAAEKTKEITKEKIAAAAAMQAQSQDSQSPRLSQDTAQMPSSSQEVQLTVNVDLPTNSSSARNYVDSPCGSGTAYLNVGQRDFSTSTETGRHSPCGLSGSTKNLTPK